MDSENVISTEYGPGRLLTDARLKLGLEQENVAEMLHLRAHQIRALEADDYDNLPEPTYVKGYLRAYCQLLGLNADEIVGRYTRHANPPVKESYEVLVSEKQAVSSDNLIKLASVGLAALIAGLAIVYWMTASDKQSPQELAATPMVEQGSGYAPGYSGENNAMIKQSSTSEMVPGEPKPDATGRQQAASTNLSAGVSTSPDGKPSVAVSNSQQVSTIPQAAAPSSPPPAAVAASGKPTIPLQATGSQTESAKTSTAQATTRMDAMERSRSRLVLKTANTSWIDVRDVYDNKLIYETVPAGREIPLEGMAPFKVFLGNAEGVQIFVEGKEFNFSRFKRGQTARFSLNVEESNR